MREAILSIVTLIAALPPMSGSAVYYDALWGNWSQISHNQGVKVPPGFTPIAVNDCGNLGRTGWMRLEGRPWRRVVVADCMHPADTARLQAQGREPPLVEVPYYAAKGWHSLGRVPAQLILLEGANR